MHSFRSNINTFVLKQFLRNIDIINLNDLLKTIHTEMYFKLLSLKGRR